MVRLRQQKHSARVLATQLWFYLICSPHQGPLLTMTMNEFCYELTMRSPSWDQQWPLRRVWILS